MALFTGKTHISPLKKCLVPSTQLCPPPSLIHLEKFRRAVQQKEPLTDDQRFPLAFVNSNRLPESCFFESVSTKPIQRKTIIVQSPAWMRYDYEHTPFEAFKVLSINAIVHVPLPQWTCPLQPQAIKMKLHWLTLDT